jgi:RND family efflux transporter MFP subunit
MAAPSVGAGPKSDALARLQIHRSPRARGSWFGLFIKLVLLIVLLGLLAAAGWLVATRYGWVSSDNAWIPVPEAMQARPEVRLAVVTVETGRAADATVVATGYLESRRQAQIGARAPGRIELINVEEGTRVEVNQVLAVLEHADLEASLAATEANLTRAKAAKQEQEIVILQRKRDLDRVERVVKTKSVSESEYELAQLDYDSAVARRDSLAADVLLAEARVREAQQMKANMFILAPFNGTVISRDAEVGESILPGGMGEASGRGSVVTVADLEHIEVDCDVKEDFITRIVSGQNAEVAVDAIPDHRFAAKVRKIIPMGDRARSTIKVKVAITEVDARLFPEMSATVYFLPAAEKTAAATEQSLRRVFIDTKAIQGTGADRYVWVLGDEDRVQRLEVTIGGERDGRSEIKSGLSGGERVIIPPPDIKAGQKARIAS